MNRLQISLGVLFLATLLSFANGAPAVLAGTQIRIYVDYAATGANDGTSWATAFNDLQTALQNAQSGAEIWVAQGVYVPGRNRGDGFEPPDGVSIYGGFDGTETALDQRDPANNKAVLSGDIDHDDATDGDGVTLAINGDNSYHVVYTLVISGAVASGYVLDGVVITGGNADGNTPDDRGGGLLNVDGSPTLNGVTFAGNQAGAGGGMFNENGSPLLNDVTFKDNAAELGGGGMFNYNGGNAQMTNVTFLNNRTAGGGGGMANSSNSSPTFIGGAFLGNVAGDDSGVGLGGGMYNEFDSSPLLANSVFSGNSATGYGGAIFVNQADLYSVNNTVVGNWAPITGGIYIVGQGNMLWIANNIIYENADSNGMSPEAQILAQSGVIVDPTYSLIGSSAYAGTPYPGNGNFNEPPQFIDLLGPDGIAGTIDDNLRLTIRSPAIDAGDNSAIPSNILSDADGNPRFQDVVAVPDTGNGAPPVVDMGAYEVRDDVVIDPDDYRLYLPLTLK